MKAKMDIAMSQHQASKQLTTQQSVDSKAASPNVKTPSEGQQRGNVTATQGFTFGQPRAALPGTTNDYSIFKDSSEQRSNG